MIRNLQRITLILASLLLPGSSLFAQELPYTETSVYVAMRDGVKLAVDVALPRAHTNERSPAIVTLTRYWRASEKRGFLAKLDERGLEKAFFTASGYAVVTVDVRGTGASTGTWPYPWSAHEIADGYDLAAWIIRQPWSDGRIGATGDSYEGSTELFFAAAGHPAVKAVAPRFIQWDVYGETAFPGGIFNEGFVSRWSAANELLDRNLVCTEESFECFLHRLAIRGVKPVDEDRDRSQLRAAVKGHATNGDLYAGFRAIRSRDEIAPGLNTTVDSFSLHRFAEAIERSGVAIFSWGGWSDGATSDGVIRRMALRNPQKAIIGPWNHTASEDANPFNPPETPVSPSREEQLALMVMFFDHYVKGEANGFDELPPIQYYTLGEEAWKATDVWPPSGVAMQTLHFAPNGSLSATAPAQGVAKYTVDFTASTGLASRWTTQLGSDVVYGDRASEDAKLLTFTSEPLPNDIETTGNAVVTLHVASTTTDAAFFAYLEDVDEHGRVTLLTEGCLRGLHRRGTFLMKDAAPLVPGQPTEIRFELIATSALVKKGHRIRVAIAGADAFMFARIPETETPTFDIRLGGSNPSRIDLPVMARSE